MAGDVKLLNPALEPINTPSPNKNSCQVGALSIRTPIKDQVQTDTNKNQSPISSERKIFTPRIVNQSAIKRHLDSFSLLENSKDYLISRQHHLLLRGSAALSDKKFWPSPNNLQNNWHLLDMQVDEEQVFKRRNLNASPIAIQLQHQHSISNEQMQNNNYKSRLCVESQQCSSSHEQFKILLISPESNIEGAGLENCSCNYGQRHNHNSNYFSSFSPHQVNVNYCDKNIPHQRDDVHKIRQTSSSRVGSCNQAPVAQLYHLYQSTHNLASGCANFKKHTQCTCQRQTCNYQISNFGQNRFVSSNLIQMTEKSNVQLNPSKIIYKFDEQLVDLNQKRKVSDLSTDTNPVIQTLPSQLFVQKNDETMLPKDIQEDQQHKKNFQDLKLKMSEETDNQEIQIKGAKTSIANPHPQRRGYYLNQDTGKIDRIIRKRKRKSGDQLSNLNDFFNQNPHWSKETLQQISSVTGLSEGQVYKWGWDQKRKQFGVEEAERMRQIEHQMDQASAAIKQSCQVQGIGRLETSTGMHNLYVLKKGNKYDDEKFKTPLQIMEKQNELLSTQSDQKYSQDSNTIKKRDLKRDSPIVAHFQLNEDKRVQYNQNYSLHC